MRIVLFIVWAFIVFGVMPLQAQKNVGKKENIRLERKDIALKPGDRCPNFVFEDISGKKVSLKSLRGKYVFIDIWASWCPPCRDELPFLKILEEKFRGNKIWFVSISCDRKKEKWQKMVHEQRLGGIQLNMGTDRTFMDAFGNRKIPRFVLVDKRGKIISPKTSRPSETETESMLRELKGI